MKINDERLWDSLMKMAEIGATPLGGVCRLALTDEERRGRDLFITWCRDAGLTVRIDEIGNIFGRRDGRDLTAKAVLVGSHLDTQPKGGRFDGAYGVLAALELIRTLNDAGAVTDKPIEIVSWTNEEGARFTPSMVGSAVFAGAIELGKAYGLKDSDGVSIEDALTLCDYKGSGALTKDDVDSYFEAHIEQGPILERNGTEIGVVSGGQAVRWLDINVSGFASHAGTTPMEVRKDAMFATAEMASSLESIAKRFGPKGLATIGEISIANASRNTIAGQLYFSVDIRHPEPAKIDEMEEAVRESFEAIVNSRGVIVKINTYLSIPVTTFDPVCVELVRTAAADLGYSHEPITSGAGHDAINLSRCVPSTMVFIPCVDGLSHNEAEKALPNDVSAGANVLLHAVASRAGYQSQAGA
jgi:N-carbamoyl-L-amino-acid hydrolase